jgi:uncharacterized glyoxalase superfamily protein PhnB
VKLERATPVLRILDEAKAREFYLDFLGFSVDFEARFHDGAPIYMQVSRNGVPILLSEHHGDGTPGTHVKLEISGLDELHAELIGKRYKYMRPHVQKQDWGTREMYVIDPFGNRLIFSEPI